MKRALYTIGVIIVSFVFIFTLPACNLNKQAPAAIGNANPFSGSSTAAAPTDTATPTQAGIPTPTPTKTKTPTPTPAKTTSANSGSSSSSGTSTTTATTSPPPTTTSSSGKNPTPTTKKPEDSPTTTPTSTTTPGSSSTTTTDPVTGVKTTTTTDPVTGVTTTTTTDPATGTTTPATATDLAATAAGAAPAGPSAVALSGADAAAAAALATGLPLLETPTLVSPERGATVDSHNVKFEWNPIAGPAGVTYNISVFDSAGNPTNDATGITGTSIKLTLYDDIYSWYVVATDPTGALSLPSDTWYFTCEEEDNAPPDLSVTSPNGGEEIEADSYFAITWYVLDDLTATPDLIISIFFSYDNGEHFQPIVENIRNKGAFNWHVPKIETDEALIKVTATDTGTSTDGGDQATTAVTVTVSGKGVNSGGVNGGGAAAATAAGAADAAAGTAAAATGKGGVNSGGVNGGGAAAAGTATTTGTAADAAATVGTATGKKAGEAGAAGATGGEGGTSGDQKTGQDVSDATFTIVKHEDDEEEDLNMVPDITVTSPNGGEEIEAGDIFGITWATLDQDFTSAPDLKIKIFLSLDAGEHFEKIAELDHNPQAFAWHVPQNIDTDLALIRITDTDRKVEGPDEDKEKEKTGQDVSDATFTIVNSDNDEEEDSNAVPAIVVTSPNGGEELHAGDYFPITWDSLDQDLTSTPDLRVFIFLSVDAGKNFEQIAQFEHNPSVFAWQVPNVNTDEAIIKIIIKDRKLEEDDEDTETAKFGQDVSDAAFTILSSDSNSENSDTNAPPDCSVTSPNGGETLQGGSTATITWYALDDLTKSTDLSIGLYLSTDNGRSWFTITESMANEGALNWHVPNVSTDSALVRMIVTDLSNEEGDESSQSTKTGMDVSDAVFTITSDSSKPVFDNPGSAGMPTSRSAASIGANHYSFSPSYSSSGSSVDALSAATGLAAGTGTTASGTAVATDGVRHTGTDAAGASGGATVAGAASGKGGVKDVATHGLKGSETLTVGAEGKTEKASHLEGTAADGLKHGVDIAAGTTMKNADGAALDSIGMAEVATKPEAPSGTTLLEAQDLTPNGSTFDPPITVTLAFDPAKLPEGTTAKDLTMGFWDGPKFVALDAKLNADGKSFSAAVSHFTVFGIVAKSASVAAPAATTPAQTTTAASAPAETSAAPVKAPESLPTVTVTVTAAAPASDNASQPASTNVGLTAAIVGLIIVAGAGFVILTARRRR